MRKGHPRFYELLKEMEELHDRKNHDYAKATDPLSNIRSSEDIGIPGFAGNWIRMKDKTNRADQLILKLLKGEGPSVKDESLKDTFRDLAVYSLFEIILLEETEAKPKIGLDKKKSSGI